MQKNIYLFLILVFASLACNAQITKGTVLLGGDIGFSTQNANTNSPSEQKITNLSINPSYAIAVKDNLVLGVQLNYDYNKDAFPASDQKQTSGTYGASIFLRNYKYLGGGFYCFGQTTFGGAYMHGTDDFQTPAPETMETKGYLLFLNFSPGIAYKLSKCWMLETQFPSLVYANYNHSTTSTVDGGTTIGTPAGNDIFSIGSSLTNVYAFSVGVRLLLGGH